jgi:hypothetical protein
MERIRRPKTVVIAESGTASTAFEVDDMAFGSVQLPADMTGTALAIEGRLQNSGSWFPIKDALGATLSITFVASTIVRLPDAAFGCYQLRLVSNGAEAAERSILTLCKS